MKTWIHEYRHLLWPLAGVAFVAMILSNFLWFIILMYASGPTSRIIAPVVGVVVGFALLTFCAWRYSETTDVEEQDVTSQEWFKQMSEMDDFDDLQGDDRYRGRHRGRRRS